MKLTSGIDVRQTLSALNVIESVSNQSDDDRDQINNILATISELNNSVPVPIKVIRIIVSVVTN